jgi:hypothetical protein
MSSGIGSHASVSHGRGPRFCLRLAIELPLKDPDRFRCCRLIANHPDPLRLRKRSKSRGPSLHRSHPASSVLCPRPTPTAAAALSRRRGRYPRYDGSPPFHGSPSRRAVPTTPADRMSAHVDYFPIRAAFPDSLAGRHPRLHFRGLLELHSCYGPPVAQPPKAAFVTRLRSGQLPSQTARQLPDLSTIIWVDSSSTGYPCLFGHTSYQG